MCQLVGMSGLDSGIVRTTIFARTDRPTDEGYDSNLLRGSGCERGYGPLGGIQKKGGSHYGDTHAGTANSLDEARAGFEEAWRVFLAARTEADFQEWRD
jgi:hypothetical protein